MLIFYVMKEMRSVSATEILVERKALYIVLPSDSYFLHHAIDQFWSVCIYTHPIVFSTSLTSCHPHEKMMVMQ